MHYFRIVGALAALVSLSGAAGAEPSEPRHQHAPDLEAPDQHAVPGATPGHPKAPEPAVSETTPRTAGLALRGLGLRASAAQTNTGDSASSKSSAGGDLYERAVGVLRVGIWSGRYFDELWIGYGGEGLRYQLAGALGFGVTWLFADAPSGDSHGLVARFAMRAHLRREGNAFSSEVRVPGGELGYNWTSGNRQFEILGHGGATLTGRFNPLGEQRRLQGATYGASLSFEWARLRLDADYSHVAASAELGAVLQARAHLCALSTDRPQGRKAKGLDPKGRPPPPSWAVCLDFRGDQGRTNASAAGSPLLESSRHVVGGLSIVLGEVLHL